MRIHTTRFGSVEIEQQDILHFAGGLLGLESCQEWVLLADAQNSALGWLQSTDRANVALAVVSPRRFVPSYQIRVARSELTPLSLPSPRQAHVLTIVSKNERSITLNLKAPLILNLDMRVGRQVITNGDDPVQYELHSEWSLKKSA